MPDYDPIPNSVAILPLADDDATPNVRTVGETMLIALKEGLGQSRHVNQITLTVDQRPSDLAAFGRDFRVATLLVGRVVQVAGGLRIEMQLFDVGSDEVSWSQEFAWDPTRISETGTAIANGILEAMGLEPISEGRFAGTENRQAYEALLEGFDLQGSFETDKQLPAIAAFQRAIDLDPQYLQAYVGLAQTIFLYVNLGGPTEHEHEAWRKRALDAVDKALQLDEQSADAISMAGMWEPNRDLKIQAYERALELDPRFGMTYFRLGMSMWFAGDLGEAERLIRKALEYYPMSGNQRGDLASLLYQQGRKDEALIELNRAIANNPRHVGNYLKLAYMSTNPVEIIRGLRKAFSLHPSRGDIAAFVATEYAALGAHDETLVWTNIATGTSPTNLMVWIMSMFAQIDIGETDKAVECAAELLELDPGNRFALRELGSIRIAAGNTEAALRHWRESHPAITARPVAAADTSDPRLVVDFAVNLVQAGETTWAHELLQALLDRSLPVLEKDPLYLLWAYALLGQPEEVLGLLRTPDSGFVESLINDLRELGWQQRPEFGFLRDAPEFQAILERYPEPDRVTALKELRVMERSGEMPAVPGVGPSK
jgi:tetratricopeptide (TPR) repeat protein/TolB-like protein